MIERTEIQRLTELPIESVASRLGLNVSRHHCLCPFHKDKHPSLSFDMRRNHYRCFVCGAHGGTINLVMDFLNKSFVDACEWLANENNIILTEYKPNYDKKEEKENTFDPNKYIKFFEHPWINDEARTFLYDERKIDPRVVRWCRLTSWKDKKGTSWLQIPYFDINGKLTGVQNRRLAASPQPSPKGEGAATGNGCRFMFPKGSKCGIYNLPVLKLLKPGEPLYIAEGCSDCWALLSSGHKAIAIPSATLLNTENVKLLKGILQAVSPPSPFGEGCGEAANKSTTPNHTECDQFHIALPPFGNSQLRSQHSKFVIFHMYPDQDEPGERLFLQLKALLSKQFATYLPLEGSRETVLVRHQLPPDCKDYSEYYIKMMKK